MKINLYKKLTLLILLTFTFPINASGVIENPYEVPPHEYSKRGSTRWRRDFNMQDIIAAMNHIEYLLEDTSNPEDFMDYIHLEEITEVYEQLQYIRDKLIGDGSYKLVEIELGSIPVDKDGRKYLAPFFLDFYGVTSKNGTKIYVS